MLTFRAKIRGILANSGFKSIAILSSGVLIAQIISLIFQPVITRLYTPESFGVLSLITSIVSMFAPILSLQYQVRIVTAKTDKEANIVCALTMYLLVLMVLIISIGLITYNSMYPNTFKSAGELIYIVIPLLFLNGFVRIVDSYNNRFEQYKLMSSIVLIRTTTSSFLKLFLGLFKFGVLGLIISEFVATFLGIRKQAAYIISKRNDILNSTLLEIKSVAKKYIEQPAYSMPGLFVTTASFSILPILISTLYDVKQTGYFYLAISILGLPLSLISTNVAKVFLRKATLEKEIKGDFRSSLKSTALLLMIISTLGFSILWYIAEPLFSIVFGSEWSRSGTLVKILIPLFAVRFVVTSVMTGFIISGKQLLKLLIQMFFVISAVLIYFFVKIEGLPIDTFLLLINNGYLIIYMILFMTLYITSKNKN